MKEIDETLVSVEITVRVGRPYVWSGTAQAEETARIDTLMRNASILPYALICDGLVEKALDKFAEVLAEMEAEAESEE